MEWGVMMKIEDFSVELNYFFKSALICVVGFFVFLLVGSFVFM